MHQVDSWWCEPLATSLTFISSSKQPAFFWVGMSYRMWVCLKTSEGYPKSSALSENITGVSLPQMAMATFEVHQHDLGLQWDWITNHPQSFHYHKRVGLKPTPCSSFIALDQPHSPRSSHPISVFFVDWLWMSTPEEYILTINWAGNAQNSDKSFKVAIDNQAIHR